MSLPFLKPKSVAGVIISHRKKDGNGIEMSHMEGDEDAGLDSCSEALIRALHAKDIKAVSKALREAFQIVDSQPHEEGEHLNDFESQNIKAAE